MPASGVVAGVYVQAISAFAPHPNAAKLWMEYLYSDEGQLGWLKGYCHPIRFNDLVARGVVPQELLDTLPPADGLREGGVPDARRPGAQRRPQSPAAGTASSARTSSKRGGARIAPAASPWAPTFRRAALLGLARDRCRSWPSLALFLILPTHADRGRRVPDARGRLHARQHRQPLPAVDHRGLLDLDPDQPGLGLSRLRRSGSCVAAAVALGGLPRGASAAGADLLRCRLELRRRATGLRLPRDAGAARAGDGAAARLVRRSTSTRWGSTS